MHNSTDIWYLSISTSTPAGIKKYLSKIQVLSNVYLKVLELQVHMYLAPYLHTIEYTYNVDTAVIRSWVTVVAFWLCCCNENLTVEVDFVVVDIIRDIQSHSNHDNVYTQLSFCLCCVTWVWWGS